MGACLRLFLSEQDQTLLKLRAAELVKVKDHAEVIRLNIHGWYVKKISADFRCIAQKTREVLHRWQR
ncbi:transposase [Calothrix sp. NIES-4071]|nr:transposase [Calothrix sp. NIES-4071]BAZ60748.1 transposase [Calothrix sp. NIES-4105]